MKPNGLTKTGVPYWHLSRMPYSSIKAMSERMLRNNMSTGWFITGAKAFEKPGKINIMVTIWDSKTKKYYYKWGATLKFTKNGLIMYVNMGLIESKSTEIKAITNKYCNATYLPEKFDTLVKMCNPAFQGEDAGKRSGTHARMKAFQNKLKMLIARKFKKESRGFGKLKIKDIEKCDFRSIILMSQSEFICNEIYYGLKKHPVLEVIVQHQLKDTPYYRMMMKRLKKYNSLDKISKSCFGRSGKNINALVSASLVGAGEQNIFKKNSYSYTKIPTLYIRPDIFAYGLFLKQYYNLDKIAPALQNLTKRILQTTALGYPHMLPGRALMKKDTTQQIKKFLAYLPPKRSEDLMMECVLEDRNTDELLDTANQFLAKYPKIVIPDSLKTLSEIHDFVSIEFRKLENGNFDLEIPENIQAINGVILGDMRLEIPQGSFDLITYGQKMNNCIGGYGRQVRDSKGKNWVMAVYKNDVLTYNIEVRSGYIQQFWASHNRKAEQNDEILVTKFLVEKELAKPNKYNHSVLRDLMGALEVGAYQQPVILEDLEYQGLDAQLRNGAPLVVEDLAPVMNEITFPANAPIVLQRNLNNEE